MSGAAPLVTLSWRCLRRTGHRHGHTSKAQRQFPHLVPPSSGTGAFIWTSCWVAFRQFQTRAEIERRIARGSLNQKEIDDLWESLYLQPEEIAELLAFVKQHAFQPWVYPLVCTAALTGARRSELLRLGVHDVDFSSDTITIHERKREHDKRTTRRVSLTPFLRSVLQEWISVRPDGPVLFCQNAQVVRSKTKRTGPTAVTRDEAHNHFKQTLAGSKWAVVKGFHTLRHSFISCLASAGVDQRIIGDFVGHQTDQQRRRYRHIFPDVKQDAITRAFASVTESGLRGGRAQAPRGK